MSGRAVRPWQSQQAASAEWRRTAESDATPGAERGLSAAGREIPSQTVCTVTLYVRDHTFWICAF